MWVVDTQTGESRRLPDLRPVDLEWRPGTDELAIAGDLGSMRTDERTSTPVTIYSVSSGKFRHLGSVDAAYVTWSPDGETLAYTAGQRDGLWLVNADGSDERSLLPDTGPAAAHGVGPVWSPRGDRILYQRRVGCCELSKVVLVDVADGSSTVVQNPLRSDPGHPADPGVWYPFTVTWSPDGGTLLYTAWSPGTGGVELNGLVAVDADAPADPTVLTDLAPVGGYHSHLWSRIQMWGREPA